MHVASPGADNGKDEITEVALPLRQTPLADPIEAARQDYLEALPIAAAVLCSGARNETHVEAANAQFCALAGWRNGWHGNLAEQGAFLAKSAITDRLTAFLASDDSTYQFESHDGQIGGRTYTVKLA